MPGDDDRRDVYPHVVEGPWKGETRRFRDGVLIVGFKMETDEPISDDTFDAMESELGATITRKNPIAGWAVFQGGWQPDQIEGVAKAFKANHKEEVAYVQPDFLVTSTGDPDAYGDQWGLRVVDMRDAWDLERGSERVLIAVVDTGMPMKDSGSGLEVFHEDIVSERFIQGVDMLGTYDEAFAENPHGLFVTGAMVATVDDEESSDGEVGIKGINQVSPVFACRAVKESQTFVSFVRDGIETVVNIRDKIDAGEINAGDFKSISKIVVNLSLELPDSELPDEHLDNLMDNLDENPDVLLCCSTGTTDRDDDGNIVRTVRRYPAAFSIDHPVSVVAVGGTQRMVDDEGNIYTDEREEIYSDSAIGEHVTLVAPAKDIKTTYPMEPLATGSTTTGYDTTSGTSMAAPFATAIASLVWSKCPIISSESVITCLRASCEDVPSTYGEEMDPREWGSGRINAYNAIPDIEVVTNGLTFVDVASGETQEQSIQLRVKSAIPLNVSAVDIQMDNGSDNDTVFRGNSVTIGPSATTDTHDTVTDLKVTYLGGDAGTSGSATVTVRCEEFGEDWSAAVRVSGNTHAGSTFVVLCADKSGSMNLSSGVGDKNRKTVLEESSGILIDYMPEGEAMDIVSFDADAHAGPGTTVIDDDPNVDSRQTLKDHIQGLVADGLTSIGDALEMAQTKLDAEPDYDNQAMIVLSDGKETAGKYISEVNVTQDVYAIGMGVSDVVNIEALTNLVLGNDEGYILVTGNLGDDDEFKIAKYLVQILADVKNIDIVSDPVGRLLPHHPASIPFHLTTADHVAEVITMMPDTEAINVSLKAPGPVSVDPIPEDVESLGDNVCCYRFDLPLTREDETLGHQGLWHVVLDVDEGAFKNYLAGIQDQQAARRVERHGMLYAVAVNVSSDVSLKVKLVQDGFTAGSAMTLRAVLRQSGIPLTQKVQVQVEVRTPDRVTNFVRLPQVSPGVFEATRPLSLSGVYECRFIAIGRTHAGQQFTREQARTAFVGSGTTLRFLPPRGGSWPGS